MRIALLALVAAAFAALPLQAEEKLWVALYLGENHGGGAQATPAMTERLREVFGFTDYKLLKGETVDLAGSERWVLSRKDFFLRVRPLPHADGEPAQVGYEIYKDGFLIADGTYVVAEDTPLFISGPDFHRGRLIFVLESH
jgi:hypothetical protein